MLCIAMERHISGSSSLSPGLGGLGASFDSGCSLRGLRGLGFRVWGLGFGV